MADDRLREAVQTVAKDAIHLLVRRGLEDAWEDYPEVGQHDWERIEKQIAQWVSAPDSEALTAAMEYLEGRAEK